MLGKNCNATEVEESDGAVGVEAVVAGVRVGVDEVGVSIVSVHEPRDGLRPGVLELLVGILRCFPVHTVEVGHRQHSVTRGVGDRLGDADEGVAPIEVAERRDHVGFVPVVDLLGDPCSGFAGQRLDVDGHSGCRAEEPEEGRDEFGVGEVVADRLCDTGVLDLDDDVAAVVQDGPMNLTDRCGRHRIVVEILEVRTGWSDFVGEDLVDQRLGHRWRVGSEPGERLLVRREPAGTERTGVDHREDLARLHQHALGVAEQFGVLLGGVFVEPFDGTVVAGPFAQPGDQSATRGAGGERGQRHGPPDPSTRYGAVLVRHDASHPRPTL